jgi:glutamate carboxypeptidase
VDDWISAHAAAIAERAPEQLAALVGLSTPSGDAAGAEAAVAAVQTMLPPGATVERPACSTPGSAPDLVARVRGTGTARVLLVGHLDTVVAHADHRPLTLDGDRLVGSGSVDMKGGDVLALGVLRALADGGPAFAEAVLLLVNDEEWRTVPFVHGPAFAHFDACLCFEAGQLTPDGDDAVVVRRKAAGTLRIRARGRSAHSGSAPHKGANALLALATAAQVVAAQADRVDGPPGPEAFTAVPTVLHAGDAFNVVPAAGELMCDLRAAELATFARVLDALPAEVGGATLETTMLREWPGMDARGATGPAARRGRRAPRAAGRRRRPRRGERRQPLRRGRHRADRRRPRPARGRRPRPPRARPAHLAAPARRGRPRRHGRSPDRQSGDCPLIGGQWS